MNKTERINEAYGYVRSIGLVHSKKEVADKMMASPTSVISALRGNEDYLTDSFLGRFAATFPVVSRTWLLTGEGEMRKVANLSSDSNVNAEYIKQLKSEIEYYKSKYDEVLDKYFKLAEELVQIKKQTEEAQIV